MSIFGSLSDGRTHPEDDNVWQWRNQAADDTATVIVQQMLLIEQLRTERDAAYQRGLAAGRAEALELAAGVCDARAEFTGDAFAREGYLRVAARIRALALQPQPTGGHGAASGDEGGRYVRRDK